MRGRPVVLVLLALGLVLGASAPASADVAAPPGREPYVVMTAGDSYAAGEGAPEVNGTYDSGGDPPLIGFTREDWDSHFGDTTTQGIETERCHRSPLSPSGVATTYLAGDFPDVQVDFESVACSGASIIKGGVLDRDNPDHRQQGAAELRRAAAPVHRRRPVRRVAPRARSRRSSIRSTRTSTPTARASRRSTR